MKKVETDKILHLDDLGILNPVGHVVIAFESDSEAEEAKRDLLIGGYDEGEAITFTGSEMVQKIDGARPHTRIIRMVGWELQRTQKDYELAKQGSAWLIAYAPTDQEGERVMNVARRYKVRTAQKYNRLTIHDLA